MFGYTPSTRLFLVVSCASIRSSGECSSWNRFSRPASCATVSRVSSSGASMCPRCFSRRRTSSRSCLSARRCRLRRPLSSSSRPPPLPLQAPTRALVSCSTSASRKRSSCLSLRASLSSARCSLPLSEYGPLSSVSNLLDSIQCRKS